MLMISKCTTSFFFLSLKQEALEKLFTKYGGRSDNNEEEEEEDANYLYSYEDEKDLPYSVHTK